MNDYTAWVGLLFGYALEQELPLSTWDTHYGIQRLWNDDGAVAGLYGRVGVAIGSICAQRRSECGSQGMLVVKQAGASQGKPVSGDQARH